MSNVTINVPVRTIDDLTVVPTLPLDTKITKDIKIPVGNLPFGVYGEALTLEQVAFLTEKNLNVSGLISEETKRATAEETELRKNIAKEINRAISAENEINKKIISSSNGIKSYTTIDLFYADQSSVPKDSLVFITTTENAGTYTWDGSTLTKSTIDITKINYQDILDMGYKLVETITSDTIKQPFNVVGYYDVSGNYTTDGTDYYHSTEKFPINVGDIISLNIFVAAGLETYNAAVLNIYDEKGNFLFNVNKHGDLNHLGDSSKPFRPNFAYDYVVKRKGFATVTTNTDYPAIANEAIYTRVNKKHLTNKPLIDFLNKEYPFKERINFNNTDINSLKLVGDQVTISPDGLTRGSLFIPVKKGDMIKGNIYSLENTDLNQTVIALASFNLNQGLLKPIYLFNNIDRTPNRKIGLEYIVEQDGYIYAATSKLNPKDGELYVYRKGSASFYSSVITAVDDSLEDIRLFDYSAFTPNGLHYSTTGKTITNNFGYNVSTRKIPVNAGDTFDITICTTILEPNINMWVSDGQGNGGNQSHELSLISFFNQDMSFNSTALPATAVASTDIPVLKTYTIVCPVNGYLHVTSSQIHNQENKPSVKKVMFNSNFKKALTENLIKPFTDKERIESIPLITEGVLGLDGGIYTPPNSEFIAKTSDFISARAGDIVEGHYVTEKVLNVYSRPIVIFDLDKTFKEVPINPIEALTNSFTYQYYSNDTKLSILIEEDCFIKVSSIITTENPNPEFWIKRNAGFKQKLAEGLRDGLVDLIKEETNSDIISYPINLLNAVTDLGEALVMDDYFKGSTYVPTKIGDTFELKTIVELGNPNGNLSLLVAFDKTGKFLKTIYSTRDFYNSSSNYLKLEYTADFNGYLIASCASYVNPKFEGYLAKTNETKKQLVTAISEKLSDTLTNNSSGNNKRNTATYVLPEPTSIVRIDLTGNTIPNTKAEGAIEGKVTITIDGTNVTLNTKYSVQGDSSAGYVKKNLSFDLFSDKTLSNDALLKIGSWLAHPTVIYKANWIDATHCRNLSANAIYEQMIQSRKLYPKRSSDVAYSGGDNKNSLHVGALAHTAGFPCVIYFNGEFYGIGSINIHKRRENYNLDKNNKKHIQLDPIIGYIKFTGDFNNTPAWTDEAGTHTNNEAWELRNPKLKGYKAGDKITDSTILASLQRLWDFNAKSPADMRKDFEKFYRKIEVIDTALLIHYFALIDLIGKNTLLTTWDGKIWSPLAFDLDSICGLNPAAGTDIMFNHNVVVGGFYLQLATVFPEDTKKRYAELRKNGVFTLSNFTKVVESFQNKYTVDLFETELNKWVDVPSKNLGGVYQMQEWLKARIQWLDVDYDYLDTDLGVVGQKRWNPPTLADKTSQTTTVSAPNVVVGDSVKVTFSADLQGTTMTGVVTAPNVVTVTHSNNTGVEVNLDTYSLQIFLT